MLLSVDTVGGDLMTLSGEPAQHDLVTFEPYGILAVGAPGSMGRTLPSSERSGAQRGGCIRVLNPHDVTALLRMIRFISGTLRHRSP
ncbi:hypothetical protein EYF80_014948 [Liparis tanakae]|uniref:Uncharacterized protein n=1 Tax=Liparis tanakae TaxID=230148 RepID=A0A4Z2IA41_9TELE|nr:hypothetical protein EYF80_014948 [Liparis tanakae]